MSEVNEKARKKNVRVEPDVTVRTKNVRMEPDVTVRTKNVRTESILHAAMDEFGKYGYEKASTNHIMESAGVSKGLIFHYYGNKPALYMACVRHIMDIYTEGYCAIYDVVESDCLKRLDSVVSYKMKFFIENPTWGRLMLDANKLWREDRVPGLSTELAEYMKKKIATFYEMQYRNLDMSKYKKHIPQDKIVEYILLVIEAYANRYTYDQMNYEELIEMLDRYAREMELVKEMILYGVYA